MAPSNDLPPSIEAVSEEVSSPSVKHISEASPAIHEHTSSKNDSSTANDVSEPVASLAEVSDAEVCASASAPKSEVCGVAPLLSSLSTQQPASDPSRAASIMDESLVTTPGSLSANTSAGNTVSLKSSIAPIKKKELMRPLFSRSSTTDKVTSKAGITKSMIVETETVDASSTPTVSLPIASSSNIISGDMMSNNSGIASNLASLRSKKSTIFIDQNNQPTAQPTVGTVFDNDNASITGSIRNPINRLNPADSHMNISKPGATKADLFAAKIANAVGDGSDSDSEETFVYESAPDALAASTLPSNKTIAALGSTNPLALRKLSQRNISMPVTSVAHPYSPSTTSHIVVTNEESKDQTVTYDTEEDSDHTSNQDQKTLTKSSAESHNLPSKGTLFTKYNGSSRKPSTTSLLASQKVSNMSQLRTTTSKLFDVKGSTLRRYSGVPDDVNIEDYLDQYDEENEVGGSDYADSFHYEDEDEDDELTPLNVNKANHNLRNKMSKHYQTKRSVSNFGSMDRGDLNDVGLSKDETVIRRPRSLKSKRYTRNQQQNQQEQQQYSPHNFYNKKRNSRMQVLRNVMCLSVTVFILLAVGFIGGFLLANTKELQEVQIVSIDDIIVSFDELIFDLSVGAYNHGLMTVGISDVELDIFAKSSHIKTPAVFPIADDAQGDVQTILLGSVSRFETPLQFSSGFFHRNYTISRGEIKLIHPGQNITEPGNDQENHKAENDLEKWRKIIKHPFDLIVKGRFIYEVPLLRTEQSVPVTKTVSVDPSDDEALMVLG